MGEISVRLRLPRRADNESKTKRKTKANRVNHLGRNNYKGSIRVAYNK